LARGVWPVPRNGAPMPIFNRPDASRVHLTTVLMDFEQLETFLEVARYSSFSRAAEKRFRTQPAISSQIRALEEEVGAKLLDRSGGKVSITASGKLFQKYAEEILEARKAVLIAIAETERVPRGEIIVGANEGTCLHILPEVFAEFKKQYPDVAVNITRADYGKILESVIDNSVDFGFMSMPVTDPRLTVVLIHRDELVVIAPPQHPLAKLKSAPICEVAKFPLVMPKAGHTRDALEDLFHENKLKPQYAMELDSSELLKRFVAADVGVGFIARSNVQEDVQAKVLVAIPMAEAPIRRDLALVFRKDKALSRAALAFIDTTVKIKTVDPVVAAKR
jgi:LysR family transcriptional regulator, low CO2-responsive transcriptional regulator